MGQKSLIYLNEFFRKPNELLSLFKEKCFKIRLLSLLRSAWWFIQGFSLSKEEAHTTVLLIGIRKEARTQVLHLSRNKRYTLTPEKLKWDKFKLTYKYLFAACHTHTHKKL